MSNNVFKKRFMNRETIIVIFAFVIMMVFFFSLFSIFLKIKWSNRELKIKIENLDSEIKKENKKLINLENELIGAQKLQKLQSAVSNMNLKFIQAGQFVDINEFFNHRLIK